MYPATPKYGHTCDGISDVPGNTPMRARHTHNKISDIPGNTPLITEMGYTHKGISDIPGCIRAHTPKYGNGTYIQRDLRCTRKHPHMGAGHTENGISDVPENTPINMEMGHTYNGISDVTGNP
jgi:hypothetical protein